MANLNKYDPKYHDDWAWSLAIRGATDKEIAESFGIATRTFMRWKQAHASLREAVMNGKEIADSKVEKSLYQKALGYTIQDTEKTIDMDRDGNPKPVRIKTITKTVQPDTMAIMYWLNNRRKGSWSQRQEVSLSAQEDAEDVVIYLPVNHRDGDSE